MDLRRLWEEEAAGSSGHVWVDLSRDGALIDPGYGYFVALALMLGCGSTM